MSSVADERQFRRTFLLVRDYLRIFTVFRDKSSLERIVLASAEVKWFFRERESVRVLSTVQEITRWCGTVAGWRADKERRQWVIPTKVQFRPRAGINNATAFALLSSPADCFCVRSPLGKPVASSRRVATRKKENWKFWRQRGNNIAWTTIGQVQWTNERTNRMEIRIGYPLAWY